jgi:hypothetical protein
MITLLCQNRRLIVLALAWSSAAGVAAAQTPVEPSMTPPSLAVVSGRVPIGGLIHVTDTTGAAIRGTLALVNDDAIQVRVKTDLRMVAAASIRRIQWQQPDSALTGVLIGAAIGAVPGIYWLIADPNECVGMCPEEYAFIAIGALIGGVIDRAVHRKVTVYSAPASSGPANRISIGPVVSRERKGVQVAVKF